ncbi:DUF5319 domain-containing protein [Corynebacterium sp. ES2715-CONJ3]|nr:DUF5319 domain-containing protein [Corynebacterium sp. ES2715-CONJ3]MCS4491425.1 DUF5319 domain-containing protein [Corynebacterium sp. ES2715-CONJ3]
MSEYWNMPRDPFADDPFDPASFLTEDDEAIELSEDERILLQRELEMVKKFRRILEPTGLKGLVFFCDHCDDEHFCTWDIVEGNMRSTLAGELAPMHEPCLYPDQDAYVSWEYCTGYLDGMHRAGRHS